VFWPARRCVCDRRPQHGQDIFRGTATAALPSRSDSACTRRFHINHTHGVGDSHCASSSWHRDGTSLHKQTNAVRAGLRTIMVKRGAIAFRRMICPTKQSENRACVSCANCPSCQSAACARRCRRTQINSTFAPSRLDERDVSRSSRHVERGMRWTRRHRRTCDAFCGRRSRVVLTPLGWR
jgi:hypothetical protein